MFLFAYLVLLLQGYQALLRIDHTLNIESSRTYPNISSDTLKKALEICHVAFEAFFEDTKHLVGDGVRADIADRIATAASQEELDKATTRGKSREKSLAAWLKAPFPLGFSETEGKDSSAYTHLVEAIIPDKHLIMFGLLNWEKLGVRPYDFAKNLLDMSAPHGASPPKAPMLKKGCFLPILKIAIKSLQSIAEEEDKERFVLESLTKLIRVFKVNFFPESNLNTGTAGAWNTKPVWNSWGHLGHIDKVAKQSGKRTDLSSQVVPPAVVALNNARENNANTDWLGNGQDLNMLRKVLCKMSLSTDFARPSLANMAYVDKTYS